MKRVQINIENRKVGSMAYDFKFIRQVEFSETDLAGIMHFSNFFRYMEATEHAFYRSLGFSVHHRQGDQAIGWPRVRAECRFERPLRFEDEVEIHLVVREKDVKSIVYDFIFRKLNDKANREIARGSFTTVCVSMDRVSGKMKAVPIPEEISAKIEVAPKELLT